MALRSIVKIFLSLWLFSIPISGQASSICKTYDLGNLCDRVKCQKIESCDGPNQRIVAKETICRCCDACVTLLDLDDACMENPKPIGSFSLSRCKAGLFCDDNTKKCAPVKDDDLPACLKVTKIRKEIAKLLKIPVRKDLWMPKCDKDGLFEPLQCKDKKCLCLYKQGERLFGNSEKELAVNMTCECSAAVYQDRLKNGEAAWMTKPHLRCTSTGDYEEVQCYDNLCFCADQKTGKPKGNLVLLDHHEFLPCYKRKSEHELTYLTNCEKQEMRENKVSYEFHLKGIKIQQGFKTVRCDIDGNFAGRQCDSQACYCTDRNGTSLKSYKIDRAGSDETKMHCRCARDEYDNEWNHGRFPVLKCGAQGQFAHHQCFGVDCYCVDEDGDNISESMPYADGLDSICLDYSLMLDLERIRHLSVAEAIKEAKKKVGTTTTTPGLPP